MEDFFQKLRKIQKKERANSTLARIDNDFYTRINKYVEELKTSVGNDPFSKEHYLLKDSQRIATEICERREHKIADAAIMNIHRSYHLFIKGKAQFDLLDTTPLNLTEEEERLYFAIIDTLKKHKETIALDKLSDDLDKSNSKFISPKDDNSKDTKSEYDINSENKSFYSGKNESGKVSNESDEVLNRLDNIKDAKIIPPEPKRNILKQISNSKNSNNNEQVESKINNNPNKSTNTSINTAIDIKSPNDHAKKDEKRIENKNKNMSPESPTNDSKTKSNKTLKNSPQDKDVLKNIDEQFIDLDSLNDIDTIENNDIQIKSIDKNSIDTILVFNELPAIIGVDGKIYGPFRPQDIITIPSINAKIFIKNKKARSVRA